MTCVDLPPRGRTDFRDRSTEQLRWNIEDNKQYHMDAAVRLIKEGTYSQRVMGELHWTLERYPNHHVALEQLIKYVLGGGKVYEFQPPECYFQWAAAFAPDDEKVLMAQAYFYWRRNDRDRAVEIYKSAIVQQPSSASANYNLGLLYFELGKFKESAECAAIAYQNGYPLPALKNKLQQKGVQLPKLEAEAQNNPK